MRMLGHPRMCMFLPCSSLHQLKVVTLRLVQTRRFWSLYNRLVSLNRLQCGEMEGGHFIPV